MAARMRCLSAIMACTAAQAFAVSLLDRRPTSGAEGEVACVHAVMRDDGFQVTCHCITVFSDVSFNLRPEEKRRVPVQVKKRRKLEAKENEGETWDQG